MTGAKDSVAKKPRGRKPTTGRYATREELAEHVWHWWRNSPMKQSQIARMARVSPTTVANILESGEGKPQDPTRLDP